MINSPLTLFLLLAAAGGIGFYAAHRPRPGARRHSRLPEDYLAGLNYLANDQPDRAVDAFLRAAELDRDTVETHFALGSLFRRRGEVDRAIRIHQNLTSRDNLTPAQREQAVYALSQDYLRAGLLDRAEKILEELARGGAYRLAAMRHLIHIHELSRDWAKAIAVHEELARIGRPPQECAIAHYWCELAELSRAAGRTDEAREHLRRARATQRRFPRGLLVRTDIALEQGDAVLAGRLLRRVVDQDAGLISEVLPRALRAVRAGQEGLVSELTAARPDAVTEFACAAILADGLDVPELASAVREFLRKDESLSAMVVALGRDPAALDDGTLRAMAAVLRRLAQSTPRFRCTHCGFSSVAHFWQCPGCKTWDSQRPLARFDLAAGLGEKAPQH
ncbi:MAG: tetratricopeptide repeat protein [Gammaproteobacteria bacterium]|nr:tetratricopeptide repeat protein [Gammaproteobacteria bacterium]